ELKSIIDINQSILVRLGGRAMDPPALQDGWENSESVSDLRGRAATLIESEFSASHFWAWKDPRACLTLPFWQQIVHNMHYVVCVRRPAEVAASLKRRNKIPEARSIYLWLLYNRAAFSHSSAGPRYVITYDEVMKDPVRQAERLAGFLDEHIPDDARGIIAKFIDPDRRHHNFTETEDDDDSLELIENPALLAAEKAYAIMSQPEIAAQEELIAIIDQGLKRSTVIAILEGSLTGTGVS
ncbi:MAG: hypothetical protein ABIQ55_06030, partial [Gemmatimonadaceae bacterium]